MLVSQPKHNKLTPPHDPNTREVVKVNVSEVVKVKGSVVNSTTSWSSWSLVVSNIALSVKVPLPVSHQHSDKTDEHADVDNNSLSTPV